MNRDPVNPQALVPLFQAVHAAVWEEPEVQEQATKALLDALLVQGCLTPDEHGEAYLEDTDDDAACLNIRIPGLGWLQVFEDGSTDTFSEE